VAGFKQCLILQPLWEEKFMKSLSSLARQTGRVLSEQVRRLRFNLERLARQVREAVARTVSEAVAEATHEALQIILQGPPLVSGPWHEAPEEFRRRSWDSNEVDDRPGWPPHRPRTLYESLSEEYEQENALDNEEQLASDEVSVNPKPRQWSRALSVGCQAAAWWLRRHEGRLSGVLATGIGVAAGLVAFLASPALASAGTAAATALGVLALADAARSAAGLAAGWL
jgi:hypothetical protein